MVSEKRAAEANDPTLEELLQYYCALPDDGRYCGRCDLPLPDDLAGKRVADLGCRRGKGACKIADRVGPEGWVLGVDPSEERVCAARAYCAEQGSKVPGAPTPEFACAPFEDLRLAGLGEDSLDVVVVNNVLNLAWDRDRSLREIVRVLAPGGMLFHAGVFADESLPVEQVQAFAAEGNVFGAASTLADFEAAARAAGFHRVEAGTARSVSPEGADAASGLAGRAFSTVVVQAFV